VKVICARKDIYEGVQVVGRAVSARTSLPILSHLLFTAEEDEIRIAATDLEIGMECTVEAKVQEAGTMTVPAKVLTEVLGALPETDVVLTADETNTVGLRCGTSEFSILGLPPEEFPMLPEVREEVSLSIDHDTLREGIRKTGFAISPDESRAILTGILMNLENGGLRLVSTDTHRLCIFNCAVSDSQGTVNAIVPGRAMNELTRIVPEGAGQVEVRISPSQILFKIGDTILISRLIEGQFPNFQKVVPTEFTRRLIVPTESFLASTKRVSIVARENSNRTLIKTENGTLVLSAESGSVGSAHEEVEIIKEGDDIKMAFNSKYLLDVLGVIDTEAIEMELSGEASAAVIRPQTQSNYTYVLMPMQLE
jgi:DNA polymerase-3 subunit beta